MIDKAHSGPNDQDPLKEEKNEEPFASLVIPLLEQASGDKQLVFSLFVELSKLLRDPKQNKSLILGLLAKIIKETPLASSCLLQNHAIEILNSFFELAASNSPDSPSFKEHPLCEFGIFYLSAP